MIYQHRSLPTYVVASIILIFSTVVQAQAEPAFDEPIGAYRVEQRTPPGVVPPPALGGVQKGQVEGEQPSIAQHEKVPFEDPALMAKIKDEFKSAYSKAGSPRIAVYFNRELSDEVREWIPGDVQKTAWNVHRASTWSDGEKHSRHDSSITLTTRTGSETYIDPTGSRVSPQEAWQWSFEDQITNIFLSVGANLVDRALILRLMAKDNPQALGMNGVISTTVNETAALEKYADILVEMRITAASVGVGYDFRGTAKAIKSGQMLGSTLIQYTFNEQNLQRVWQVSDQGYEIAGYISDLRDDQISRLLTHRLMESMSPNLR